MQNTKIKKILSELEQGYDLIADKFSSTRAFLWRDLGFVKDMVKPGDRALDFGCGNGRLAWFLSGGLGKFGREGRLGEYVGVDISQKLIDIAKQKYSSGKTKFIKIEPLFNKSPFDDNYFNVVFSIAVFHHFPSKEYSLKIAKELHRVLVPGGKIVVSVWNLWQKQYLKYHKKTKKDWIDAEIPFKSGEKVFERYHHPFKMGELEEVFEDAGFETMKTKEDWNLLYIGEKLDVSRQNLTGDR